MISEQNAELTTAHKTCTDYTPPRMCFTGNWGHVTQAGSDLTTWHTGFEVEDLRCIGVKSTELPEGFKHHPTLNRAHIVKRTKMMESGLYCRPFSQVYNYIGYPVRFELLASQAGPAFLL